MKALFTRYFDHGMSEQAVWFLVWFCLPLSLKLSGASLFVAAIILLVNYIREPFIPAREKIIYLLMPVIFFVWHATQLIFDHPFQIVWKETEQMLSLLFIPLLSAFSRIRKEDYLKSSMAGLLIALLIVGSVMLSCAVSRFTISGDWNEFIYHNLAKPFSLGAVYMSLFLLFALFNLGNHAILPEKPGLKMALFLFFLLLLVLSASKLMIGVGLPLLGWHYRAFVLKNHRKKLLWFVAIFILLSVGAVPFLKRTQFLLHPKLETVNSASFKSVPEPNGLTLRLILWRFGLEIMQEQKAWFWGVGMSHSQQLLNDKIAGYGMYTGTHDGSDTGYLNYNYHNQFVETSLRAGLPGLVILIAILLIFARQRRENLFAPKLFMLLIAGFFITESVLERQAGIIFFCLVFSAFFTNDNHVASTHDRKE